MSRRHRMGKRSSKMSFKRGASRIHKLNSLSSSGGKFVMRGGIRL